MEVDRLVDTFMDQESMHCMEGARGVRNLAKLVNVLGYSDFSRYGQMEGGACLGDIFAFLEDNSGAIEALVDWIKTRSSPEWKEALRGAVVDWIKTRSSPEWKEALRGAVVGPVEDDDEDTEWDEMEPLFPNGLPDRI